MTEVPVASRSSLEQTTLALSVALLVGSGGCSDDRQLMVWVDSDISMVTSVEVVASRPGGVPATHVFPIGRSTFPLSFGVAEPDGGGTVYLSAVGFDASGQRLASTELSTGFPSGDTRRVLLYLSEACLQLDCADGQTCMDGACTSVPELDPSELALESGGPPTAPTASLPELCGIPFDELAFGAPERVATIPATRDDFGNPIPTFSLNPFVTADGLHLYYSTLIPGIWTFQVRRLDRPAPSLAWGPEQTLSSPTLRETDSVHRFAVSADGKTALFVSDRWTDANKPVAYTDENGNPVLAEQLWQATRSSTDDPFGTPELFPGFRSSQTIEADPWPSRDGDRWYFLSTSRSGGVGGQDLYVVERGDDGRWQEAELLSGISSVVDEDGPTLSADERIIIFGSGREGTLGGKDLWMSWRPNRKVAFDPAHTVSLGAPVNTPFFEGGGPALVELPDQGVCELYFSAEDTSQPVDEDGVHPYAIFRSAISGS